MPWQKMRQDFLSNVIFKIKLLQIQIKGLQLRQGFPNFLFIRTLWTLYRFACTPKILLRFL